MKNNQWLLYILVLIKFAFPYIIQDPFYQPHRDEFLYLAEGKHLAWGYLEVPPLLSLFAWLTNILGDGFFWIKFWPSLIGAATYFVTGKIILSIGGKLYALFLGFLPFIFGAYLRVHFLFQPNCLEIFFYTLIAYTAIKYIQTEKNKWLYIFGVACGLGLLSKYSVAFFIASLMFGLLLTPQRKIFFNKHFYAASLIALLLIFPNIIWQYNYHFPLIHHMQELQETQLKYISTGDFLKNQLLMNLPCFFVWIGGLFYLIASKKGRKYIALFFAYFGVIGLLIFFHGKDYYALGLYPYLIAFGAYFFERITIKRVRFMRYVFLTFPFYIGITFIPISLPIFKPSELADFYEKKELKKYGVLKWEDQQNHPLPQDFADMIGWKEIAEKTAGVYNNLSNEDKAKTLIKCDNYGLCGALNFYRKKLGLPEVYSYNATFLLWMPEKYNISNVITVGEDFPDTTRPIVKKFVLVSVKDELKDSLARQNGTKIILWEHCNEDTLSRFIENEVAERKKIFLR